MSTCDQKDENYVLMQQIIDKVQKMAHDSKAEEIAKSQSLCINTVNFEDCARNKFSVWGPCISDMTLQVNDQRMPVIREPNYIDTTWDVEIDKIPIIIGNEDDNPGAQLRTISLRQYLENFNQYISVSPTNQKKINLLHHNDKYVIMSSQCCFLPIEKGKETKFNVTLFNYQSKKQDPAVLVIVATSKGTSAQIIEDNEQKLLFNNYGHKADFIGQRLTDNRIERNVAIYGPMTKPEKQDNCIVIIQVPLKQKSRNIHVHHAQYQYNYIPQIPLYPSYQPAIYYNNNEYNYTSPSPPHPLNEIDIDFIVDDIISKYDNLNFQHNISDQASIPTFPMFPEDSIGLTVAANTHSHPDQHLFDINQDHQNNQNESKLECVSPFKSHDQNIENNNCSIEDRKMRKLFVDKLDESITEDDIFEVFSKYGEIEEVAKYQDRRAPSRYFAFVVYKYAKDCVKATNNPRSIIRGKECMCMLAVIGKQYSGYKFFVQKGLLTEDQKESTNNNDCDLSSSGNKKKSTGLTLNDEEPIISPQMNNESMKKPSADIEAAIIKIAPRTVPMLKDEGGDIFCAQCSEGLNTMTTKIGYDLCRECGERQLKFDELNGMNMIERDTRYPIRVTLQYYKSTDNGILNMEIMKAIKNLLTSSQKQADYIGSLVTNYSIRSTEFDLRTNNETKTKTINVNVPDPYNKIAQILEKLNIKDWDKYLQNFKNEEVTDDDLTNLSYDDLLELIPKIGPRNRFLEWLKSEY